jgi:hypothetical protein
MRAHGAQSARGILPWRGPAVARRDTIAQHKGSDATVIAPFRDLLSLVINGKETVSTTRTNNDCRAIAL